MTLTAAFKDAYESAPQPLTTVVRHNWRFLAIKRGVAAVLVGSRRRTIAFRRQLVTPYHAAGGTGNGREETAVHAGVQGAGCA